MRPSRDPLAELVEPLLTITPMVEFVPQFGRDLSGEDEELAIHLEASILPDGLMRGCVEPLFVGGESV